MSFLGKRLGCFAAAAVMMFSAITVFSAEVENSTEVPIYGEEPASSVPEPLPPKEPEEVVSQPEPPEQQTPPEGTSSTPEEEQTPLPEEGEFAKNPVRARVQTLISETNLADGLFPERTKESIVFEAVVLEGPHTGMTVSALRPQDEAGAAFSHPLRGGDEIYLTLYRDETDTIRGTFSDFSRFFSAVWVAVGAFALLLVCVRRLAGLKLLGILVFWGLGVVLLIVPFPSLPIACLVTGLTSLLATVLLYGIKYRTLAAGISTLLSLAVTGCAGWGLTILFHLSGARDALALGVTLGVRPDLRGLLLAGIMLAGMGAIIVVCNAAAGGVEPQHGALTPQMAFRQGMNRGAAAMTPAALILGFPILSGLIMLLVLLYASGMPAGRILSDELVVTVIAIFTACLSGLAVSVPLSAGLGALLLHWRLRPDGTLREFHVAEALEKKEESLFGKAAEKLDEAIRTTEGKTERVERDIEEEENRMDREFMAEEAVLRKREKKAVHGASSDTHFQ